MSDSRSLDLLQQYLPFTVLKLATDKANRTRSNQCVATALTTCGIETSAETSSALISRIKLQQRLPLAVLKHIISSSNINIILTLQQHLPLAVLKRHCDSGVFNSFYCIVATALTACGIETFAIL